MLDNKYLECWIINTRLLLGHVHVAFSSSELFPYSCVTEKPSKAESNSTAREPSAELIILLAVQMHRATSSFKNLPVVRLPYLVLVSGG